MGQNPEELRHDPAHLRHDIERTREGMGATLDEIEDRISPSRIVERRKARVRNAVSGARDRVMGTAQHVRAEGQARASGAGARLERVGEELGDRMEGMQAKGQRQYEGSPLTAGLIAFGVGALAGSLLPKTEPERAMAHGLQEGLEPVAGELRAAGEEVAHDLRAEARDRFEDVKGTSADAARIVQEDAREGAEHVRDETRGRTEHVKDQTKR